MPQVIPIQLYHFVAEHRSDFIAPYTVSPATFRRHLDAVAATGATTLTVSGMLTALAAGTMPGRPVLVTFDDGYRDTLTSVAPALAERGMTSTVYVTTERRVKSSNASCSRVGARNSAHLIRPGHSRASRRRAGRVA